MKTLHSADEHEVSRSVVIDQGETDLTWLQRHNVGVRVGGMVTLMAGIAAGTAAWIVKDLQEQQASHKENIVVLSNTFGDDGLTYVPGESTYADFDEATVDLGGCQLGGIEFDTTRDEEGDVIDTGNYRFSGTAYPEFSDVATRRSVGLTEITHRVDGLPFTLSFENIDDLTSPDKLGKYPCATVLGQITREQTYTE